MLISPDYTWLRTAVLTEDVIDRLLQRYDRTYYNLNEVKEINLQLSKEFPGKEDLVTEWFLRNAEEGLELGDYIEVARFFFTHYNEQLFKDVVNEHNEENDTTLNPKNLLDFDFSTLYEVMGFYEEKIKAKTINILPDQLPPGARLIYDDGRYQIVEVFELEAVCALGKGTRWCTKEEQSASRYLSKGSLFILYRGKNKWAQMTLGGEGEGGGSVEINDIKNRPFKINDEMRNVLIESGFMGEILKKITHSYDPDFEFVRLVGDNPSPYIAKECAKHPLLASLYAEFIIGGPFPAGEMAIAKDSYEAMRYVRDATKGRFLMAEPLIIQSGLMEQYADLLKRVNNRDYLEFSKSVMNKRRDRDEDYGQYVE
jgi:hypothetical protein